MVDELSYVYKDINELTKYGRKLLGYPLDICTIITKIKVDWSFVKGDVEYLEIDNHWIYLCFANPNDWFLVWSERLCHIQGELFVI